MSGPIGILGGTFDPVHYGHLRLAAEVRAALDLPAVHLVPAAVPPHRNAPFAAAEHRLAMVRLGTAEFKGLIADDLEIVRGGVSFTVNTLGSLHESQPTRPLLLLLGADAFAGFSSWHQWERIFTVAHLVVVARPGYTLTLSDFPPSLQPHWLRRLSTDPARLHRQLAGSIYVQTITPQPISSTIVRSLLANQNNRDSQPAQALQSLIPPSVLEYIQNNHLYGSAVR